MLLPNLFRLILAVLLILVAGELKAQDCSGPKVFLNGVEVKRCAYSLSDSLLATLGFQPVISGVKIDIFRANDLTKPVATQTFAPTDYNCNLTPSPENAAVINPTKIEWDDPSNPGRACLVFATTLLNRLPAGDYVGKFNFNYSDGTIGGTSNTSNPFTRFIPLTTPLAPRFVR
jgi:hypothetical protein